MEWKNQCNFNIKCVYKCLHYNKLGLLGALKLGKTMLSICNSKVSVA